MMKALSRHLTFAAAAALAATYTLGVNPAFATGDRIVLGTGPVQVGATLYPNAVITYNPVMDASDVGSNPGIELWRDAVNEAAATNRIARSNDNNGQWDYDPVGAFFSNNTVFVYGTRTGSHGPQGRVWTYTGGSFLTQYGAAFSCEPEVLTDTREQYGPFAVVKGTTTYPAAYVTYDPSLDASDAGSNPGIEVWPTETDAMNKTSRKWRSNDNNGQWDYRVDCVFAFDGVIRVIGARSPNGGATFSPRVWATLGGDFLTQSVGFELP
jgi:hypothetical protein